MRASVKDNKRNLLRTIIIHHIILEIYNSMNTPERSERSSIVPGMT